MTTAARVVSAEGGRRASSAALRELKQSQKRKSKAWNWAKVILSLLLPLGALAAVCTVTLIKSRNDLQEATAMDSIVTVGQRTGGLAKALLNEAAISCQFHAVSRRTARSLWSNLSLAEVQARNRTDVLLREISYWFPNTEKESGAPELTYFHNQTGEDGEDAESKQDFMEALHEFREDHVDEDDNPGSPTSDSCHVMLDWYTDKASELLSTVGDALRDNGAARLWTTVSAWEDILHTKLYLAHMRALGASYFSGGNITHGERQEFAELYGIVKNSQNSFLTKIDDVIDRELVSSYVSARAQIDAFAAQIIRDAPNADAPARNRNALMADFSADMESYIELFERMEESTVAVIRALLDDVKKKVKSEFLSTLVPVTLVAILCPLVLISYAVANERMMNRATIYTTKLAEKKQQLFEERKRTETILCQMLPPSVVKSIRENRPVEPESFDCVTILFTDIVGFTTICSKSSPLEIIKLLNELYSLFDKILERYDAYKVETIGDAYMVVSGAPHRNNYDHVSEICTVALEMMAVVGQYSIPHMLDENVRIRAGIHSGPCMAGVVGLKMPRYCLYGDTVNVASRMESTSLPGMVQISCQTEEYLNAMHSMIFETQCRGLTFVKGKGNMTTFWLLSKKNFGFKIRPSSNSATLRIESPQTLDPWALRSLCDVGSRESLERTVPHLNSNNYSTD